jgi:hypothetical protein
VNAVRAAADRLAGYVNPDGTFSDRDRARRGYLSIGKQGADAGGKPGSTITTTPENYLVHDNEEDDGEDD